MNKKPPKVLKGFVVVLDKDMQEDDAESIRKAISMLKGVLNVKNLEVKPDDHVIRQRVQHEYWKRIQEVFWPPPTPLPTKTRKK